MFYYCDNLISINFLATHNPKNSSSSKSHTLISIFYCYKIPMEMTFYMQHVPHCEEAKRLSILSAMWKISWDNEKERQSNSRTQGFLMAVYVNFNKDEREMWCKKLDFSLQYIFLYISMVVVAGFMEFGSNVFFH